MRNKTGRFSYVSIPANESLEWEIVELLSRPPGRPSRQPLVRYKSFLYQAGSWSKPRRIVAKVEHHQKASCSRESASLSRI
ncbi:MAG: transposase [Acidobacteria bacterium]|nr:transposase [Acidobacteriota bacterium]